MSKYNSSCTMFTEEEERDLFREYQTTADERRKERLYSKIVLNFSPLVYRIQKSLSAYQLPSEDLIQEGMLALSEAAKRYDVTAENRFSAFAYQWIRGFLLAYVLKNFSMVNYFTNASKKSLFFRLRSMIAHEQRKNNTFQVTPEIIDGIAKKLNVETNDIYSVLAMFKSRWDSLDQPLYDSGEGPNVTPLDLLEDTTPNYCEQDDHHQYQRDIILKAMEESNFTDREKIIIERQFLQDQDDCATLDDLGSEMGVSKERIRQIRNKAYTRLARRLKGQLSSGKLNLYELLAQ